ncbi:MAG: dihydrolipoyl dehydrogenase [Elusimicrobiaceae bacterium]|nr:dihydrolipoyl dehydrogenase [Elusimicrobiaceae bacterium]
MKHVVVIGGGPAGYPAALKAAGLGVQVTLIEKDKLGGVCLNRGCIPSKSFLDAAHRFQAVLSAGELGHPSAVELAQQLFALRDFDKVKARQQAATRKLSQGISFLLKKANVHVLNGEASFIDQHTLSVSSAAGKQMLSFDGAILATGSQAFYPAPFDTLRGQIYDNSNFFEMDHLPKDIAVIGGGVIGCEMADFLQAFGVKVHLIELQSRLLPQEEENASRILTQEFIKRGISLHVGVHVTAATKIANEFSLILSNGEELRVETVLASIGRTVDLTALQLERIGITWDRKGVRVNPQTMQLKENVYAAGDVTGLLQLAHAATRQGEVAACNLCGVPAQYHNERIARAIYTTPEIAGIGLTKEQAKAQGMEIKTHKSFLLANGRAVAQNQTEGYAEWISDASSGKIVGASLVGAHASELIQIAAVALEAGLTVEQMKQVVFAHPTFAESLAEALNR